MAILTAFASVILSFLVAMGLLLAVTIFRKNFPPSAAVGDEDRGQTHLRRHRSGCADSWMGLYRVLSQAITQKQNWRNKTGRLLATTLIKELKEVSTYEALRWVVG